VVGVVGVGVGVVTTGTAAVADEPPLPPPQATRNSASNGAYNMVLIFMDLPWIIVIDKNAG
jgi:hypothetical protein